MALFLRRLSPLFPVVLCTIFVSVVFLPANAHSTVMRYADVERLVEISEQIVHATVVEHQIITDKDGTTWTHTTLDVHHTYLGSHHAQIVVRQWGANPGDRWGGIAGDPHLGRDQELVLFLRHVDSNEQHGERTAERHVDPDDEPEVQPHFALAALGQAVYEVRHQDGHQMVQRQLDDLAFAVTDTTGTRAISHREPPHLWSVFVDILKALINDRLDENEGPAGIDSVQEQPQ